MNVSLQFPLEVENNWPPVGSESLPFKECAQGFEALVPPLFVKDMSVGDVICATLDEDRFVRSWEHLKRSHRSTVWLLRLAEADQIERCLEQFRSLGCNTAGIEDLGCYSVDVPAEIPIAVIDAIIDGLDPQSVAVAYPSLRHADETA